MSCVGVSMIVLLFDRSVAVAPYFQREEVVSKEKRRRWPSVYM
jgi:hypothetical protein